MEATPESTSPDIELRLRTIASLCNEIASGLNNARSILRANAEDAEVAYMTADCLDRLGWFADQATTLADPEAIAVGGNAAEWLAGHERVTVINRLNPLRN